MAVLFVVASSNYDNELMRLKSQILNNTRLLKTLQVVLATNLEKPVIYTVHNVLATAYSNDEGSINKAEYRDGLTATGFPVGLGIIAVDPEIIPYGSIVYIPQLKRFFIALDTGSAIKGRRIDIFMRDRKEALRFGRRVVDVVICGQINWMELRGVIEGGI
jgi:3D (Asp-Asp-Asp) domain-containing protein